MKAIKILMILMIMGILTIGCSGTRSFERGVEVGGLFGGTAYLLTKDPKVAIGAGIVGTSIGAIIGSFEEDRGKPIGGKPYKKGFEFPPLPSTSSPFPKEEEKEQEMKIDRRIILIARDGRRGEGDIPVMAVVTKELKKKGATVLAKKDSSAPYRLEFYTERNGDAFVYLFLIRQVDDAIIANGLGSSEFYYGYSNDNRPWEYAACRAMANLM